MQQRMWMGIGLLAVLLAGGAWGFNPPIDTKAGVTLSLNGFEESGEKDRVIVRKVPTEQSFTFEITLKNTRAEAVSGTVHVWLNDDWTVVGTNAVALQAAPGKSATVACSAVARTSVLSALYPVHAQLALTLDGTAVDLHPIAIFEAVRPAAAKRVASAKEAAVDDGVLRLDSGADRRVFYRQAASPVELGANFAGADAASGMHMTRESIARGDVSRACFAVHPPYRGGPGVTWNEFRLALPAGKPAALTFFTSLRDSSATEPLSDGVEFKVIAVGQDGVEKELFTRFSACKTWEPGRVDLGAYAGQHIALRLWTGPGPKNNTTCDQAYWGDPLVSVGALPPLPAEEQWKSVESEAVARARAAVADKPQRGTGIFRLEARGRVYGAGVALGRQGLTDGVIAFTDGSRVLTYRGFACEVDRGAIGAVEGGQPVLDVEATEANGAWVVVHRVARLGGRLALRARLSADGGALRIAWDMPGAVRDLRGTPRYTRLGIGPGSQAVWRAYAGFGNVIEQPGAFELHGGGFILSTRHVGADYVNGFSLVQACDVFPDRLLHSPGTRRFALETAHDAAFLFVPSSQGAFAAARVYRDLNGFGKGKGVETLKGRVCFDQWGGDYGKAAEDLKEAGRYGLNHSIFVKHVWQRWGYDYRLPEIYPPAEDGQAFLSMRAAAEQAGILFCPHDNYIDFYPDAEGYSYDRIVFHEDGTPMKAWYNKGRRAQSYRWLPHGFRPWLEPNMQRMHDGFHPDALFIDVFTAISPFDYYDRAGTFYPRTLTVKEWRAAFDTCRAMLKDGAPMVSEAGADSLIGSIDAGEADHFPATRWMKDFGDSERTPWHDMATHGNMVLLAGGLGGRYSAEDWEDHGGSEQHTYGSDDYLSNTVIGGRNPMCDGPFSRRAVMTYWLLHDVCDALAHSELESHAFGANVHQQCTTFSGEGQVWANRGSNLVWTVGDSWALPQYGFYATTPAAKAGIVLIDGRRAAFAASKEAFFADARPAYHPLSKQSVSSEAAEGRYVGNGVFEVAIDWNVFKPVQGYVAFLHVVGDASVKSGNAERIAFQSDLRLDPKQLAKTGAFRTTTRIAIPSDLPAGTYRVRYGLYRPGHGDRLSIRGLTDGGQRVLGGAMKVEKAGGAFTAGAFELERDGADEGVNTDGKRLDFGPVVTDGAFRLLHPQAGRWSFFSARPAWQIVPLPGSNPFHADLKLASLGAKDAKVKAVEKVEPFDEGALAPVWKQDGGVLRVACDGQSFAYRIVFE